MSDSSNLKKVVEGIVSSYETKVESISSIFDSTPLILNGLQQSILDTKEEREKVNNQLKDILAKNEHLRRKDFDDMMQRILSTQEQREKEVRHLLKNYFNEQKTMAHTLREGLEKFKDSLGHGELARVKEFQGMIGEILAKQNGRKNEIVSKLKEFQKEQGDLAIRLKELLTKGNSLRIRDFKSMLKEFRAQREQRLALQKKRKEEVAKMLTSLREKRLRTTSSSKATHSTPFTTKNLSTVKEGGVNIDTRDGQKG